MHLDRAASSQRWHIQVSPRRADLDGHGRDVLADVRQIGLEHIEAVRSSRIYLLEGRLLESDVRLLAEELLSDPVAEVFQVREGFARRDDIDAAVEVHPLPGVMNPAALSTLDAAGRLLAAQGRSQARVEAVQTARRYVILGARNATELEQIAAKVLANNCIETWFVRGFGRSDPIPDAFPTPRQRPFELRHIPIRPLTDDELTRLSREAHLFLSLAEMRAVRDHFDKLNREPTDLELETLAQTWSEHCVHKTLKSSIVYRGEDFGRTGTVEVRFDNLLKETIVAATAKLNRDWCLSVFVDNAGVVAFDEEYGIAFKVETHNHPSAIEPYGGAATGVGGCIRDIMGCGLGAKPIASTDVFCLAPPDFDPCRLPTGVLHPRRVLKGVVGGVRDYGNRMGIPTVNGAIYFDERYLANPLVFCGCLGLIPRDRIAKKPRCGDLIVVAGGRTGRDGIHGATFSSAELTEQHADEFAHAVQIGNAIEEKKLLDALLIARDDSDGCLYTAVTDCGAGGLSSAVGEMGEELGAVVDLEKVPLKYAGLRYDEIWISEAQERMVFAVPPDRIDRFLSVFAAEEVEATVFGTFTSDQILRVQYNGKSVGELNMAFLHHGLPRTVRTATWNPEPRGSARADARQSMPSTANDMLLQSLSSLNVASKEWVIRQYDHEVQGRSVIKPLVGPGFGPSDAAVLRPIYTSFRGIALGCGLCPEWTDVDPYWMAVRAIDEALRNVICVGGDPDLTAILDNFCWPKCDSEESLGALVRACRGASDAAIAYGLPFISGKDSLNNEFSMSLDEAGRTGLPQRMAIPGTLLVSALAQIQDVLQCVSMDLKEPGNCLVLASAPVEKHGMAEARSIHHQVAHCIRDGKVRSAHDVSDGGLATTLAEMCIASGLGAAIDLPQEYDRDSLFTPVATTYILEMKQGDAKASGFPIIGKVTKEPRLSIARGRSSWIDQGVDEMARGLAIAPGQRWSSLTMADMRVLVIRAAGINCDEEVMHAWRLAGASPSLVHINALARQPSIVNDYCVVTIPGGFSYGDDIAAGAILARRLQDDLADSLRAFVDRGGGVMGICNGFQVLVKMGLLPGGEFGRDQVTVTFNASAKFEARWVRLEVCTAQCPYLKKEDFLELPVEHAEGKVVTADDSVTDGLLGAGRVALRYVDVEGRHDVYPANPNGSTAGIAGLCDPTGRIFGLMPHPDRHFDHTQHPHWTRRNAPTRPPDGLTVFQNAVRFWSS